MAKYSGTVKSFGVAKGYGFIECAQISGDVFFGRHDMHDDLKQISNQTGLLDFAGREVLFGVAMKEGKQHATDLTLAPMEGQPLVGSVKSFNPTKGYGFFSCSALGGADVFFAKRDVPIADQALPMQGRAAVFTPMQQADGKAQAKDIRFVALGAVPGAAVGRMPQVLPQLAGLGLTSQQLMHLSALGMPGPAAFGGAAAAAPGAAARGGGLMDGQGAQGTVRTFSADKGFGFITCPAASADLYFKSSEDIQVGMELAFTVKIMPDGKMQARDIVAALAEGQTAVGTVRSYNGAKGFGFIRIPDQPNDVHFKKEAVPVEMQMQDLLGKTVRFTITIHHGKPQAQSAQFLARPPVGYVAPLIDAAGSKRAAPVVSPYLANSPGFGPAPPAKRPKPTANANVAALLQSAGAFGGAAFGGAAFGGAAFGGAAAGGGGGLTAVGQMTGMIKSFNPGKGFGFIETPLSPGADVYFKASHLGMHAQTEGLAGSSVSFHASSTPDGKLQGSNIVLL